MRLDHGNKGIAVMFAVVLSVVVAAVIAGSVVYLMIPQGGGAATFTTTVTSTFTTTAPPGAKTVTIGIEHFSTIAGSMWCDSHDRSIKNLIVRYPWLKQISAESVALEDINPVAEDMIKSGGANIVVQDAEFIGLPIEAIAPDYPDTIFLGVIHSHPELVGKFPNWVMAYPKAYQVRYLAGMVMGALSKNGKIGVVCSFPTSDTNSMLAAIILGAREINPNAQCYIGSFVGSYYDPPTETEVARKLVEDFGVDVLHNPSTDSLATMEVARSKGLWYVGKDADIVGTAGEAWILWQYLTRTIGNVSTIVLLKKS